MIDILEQLKKISDGFVTTLGQNYEVVIHDFSSLDASVVHVAGNVTGRNVGSPITDILLQKIRNNETDKDIINLKVNLSDGRVIKSTSIFLHDDSDKTVGCFSLNVDITKLMQVENVINELISFENKEENEDIFSNEINQVFEKVINQCISSHSKPVHLMSKEDKLEMIKKLDQKGVFLVRGGVERVGEELGVSRFSIYNYINEIKDK